MGSRDLDAADFISSQEGGYGAADIGDSLRGQMVASDRSL
jgi:hypothetical protein